MRTSLNILFLSTILSLVLCSCVQEPGEFKPSLNVFSLLNPDAPFEVVVSSTAPALGSHENLEVKNAEVYIVNNQTQEVSLLTHTADGIYISNGVKPIPGYDYEIQVEAPNFDKAYSATYVPDLDNVDVFVPENQSGNEEIQFTFSAKLQSSNSSYFAYELIYSGELLDEEDDTEELPLEQVSLPVSDGKLDNPTRLNPILGAVSDGSTTTISGQNTVNPNGELASIENVSLRIVAVSAQYYDYLMHEQDPRGIHYSSVYVNENNIFTNFVGAYGIFGGFNERTIKLVE